MYKHILAAVDDSETSNRALDEAISLAKDQRAELTLVYVLDTVELLSSATVVDMHQTEKGWSESAQELLKKAWERALKAGVKPKARLQQTMDVPDRVAQAILSEAKRAQADLIIAGTHGRTGLSRVLMGSVAEGLVRHAAVPILLVRRAAPG